MSAAAAQAAPADRRGGLPPFISVTRFVAATELIERLYDENADLFTGRMQDARERARASSRRELTPTEAAQLALSMSDVLSGDVDPVDTAARLQDSGLRAVDEPAPMEVLLAAGVSTAPAFVRAAMRFLALMELDEDQLEEALDAGEIDEVLDDAVKQLRRQDLEDVRNRTREALEMLGRKAGVGQGEALRLLIDTVWQALNQAANQMAPSLSSGLSSLTDSPAPTDGPSETSDTESPSGVR